MVAWSLTKVHCGIGSCNYYGLKKNLKSHFKRKHPNRSMCTKETFGKEQPPIDMFYPVTEVISDAVGTDTPETPTHPEIENIYHENIRHAELVAKMDEIIDLLKLLVEKLPDRKVPEYREDQYGFDPISIRSISELQRLYGSNLVADRDASMLYCCLCKSKGTGIFSYDFTEGESFEQHAILPRKFSNLKKNLLRHFNAENHLKEVARCQSDEPTSPEATEPMSPEVTEPTTPEVTEPTTPEVTEPSSPMVTDPTSEVDEPSSPVVTEPDTIIEEN